MNRNHILALTLVCLAFFSTLIKKEFFSSDKNTLIVGNPSTNTPALPPDNGSGQQQPFGSPSFGIVPHGGNTSALAAPGTNGLEARVPPMLNPSQPNSRQLSSNRPNARGEENGDSLKQTVDGLRGGDASDGRMAQRNIYFDALAEQMKGMKKSNSETDETAEEETEGSEGSEITDDADDNAEEIYGEEDSENDSDDNDENGSDENDSENNDSENNDETEDDAALVDPIDNETAELEEPEFENNGDATTNSIPIT